MKKNILKSNKMKNNIITSIMVVALFSFMGTLHAQKQRIDSLVIKNGSEGANKVLISDANGNATWGTAIPATTNTLSSATNTITSTVNGVVATAPAVNTVANTFNSTTRALTTTVNGVAGTAVTLPGGNDSTTASNGLTLTGKNVTLGGALTGATTLTTTAANTLSLAGLQSGGASDSVVVVNPSTGVLARKTNYDFAPRYGSVYTVDATYIAVASGADNQVLSFSIPASGVYLINYHVRIGHDANAANQFAVFYLSSTTSSAGIIPNTEILGPFSVSNGSLSGNYSGSYIYTATGATTLYVRVKAIGGNVTVATNANGRTYITYVKIAN